MKNKLLLSLFALILTCSESVAQKSEEPDFGVIVMYRIAGHKNVTQPISINNFDVCIISRNTRATHKIYSEGPIMFTAFVIDPAIRGNPKQVNLEIRNNDTLYLRISYKGLNSVIVQKTKYEYLQDIAEVKFQNDIQTKENLALTYNPITDKKRYRKSEKNGTGFLISSEGYIVTNYHVVEDATEITVKGVNGNAKSSLSASLVLKDETNDLVILKLDDNITIGAVPYTFKKEISDIGERVYVLGYPLINTMGSEIKLTDGLISAKSGFEGNINSYQVSSPVQPGNSGGPVFDSNGNIIGVINAKHFGAENVGYAIKSKYLFDLLDASDKKLSVNTENKLTSKPLTEQTKEISNFVYIIMAR